MNRIVLIGNGFDLAHGLPTSYNDFIRDYWRTFSGSIFKDRCLKPHEAEMVQFKYTANASSMIFPEEYTTPVTSSKELLERIEYFKKSYQGYYRNTKGIELIFTNAFFKHIDNKANIQKWVDIENEYYTILKRNYQQVGGPIAPTELNQEFECLETLLTQYLTEIQGREITTEIINHNIGRKIFEPFNIRDISNGGQELFWDEIGFEVAELPGGMCGGEIEETMASHPEYSFMRTKKEAYRTMIKDKWISGQLKDFISPNRTLLLNFNYTDTAERLYAETAEKTYCESIYIHGKLNDSDNPIIFGYGDEMDEHYKEIVNLNDNDYLHNIKSIRYLETENYRNLLSFIDSGAYQIYSMGHSCGNSDRTLLNTLFEHKNCVSIKPFYYIDKDGNDNYIDIIQNISRNFKDATLMRDRVVNKRYCEPLPQNKTV